MNELKRFFKSVWHITLSSFLTMIIYLLMSIFLQAVANDSTDDGQFSLILFIVMLVCELVCCAILYFIRFHNNDDMESAFMKEYLDDEWHGVKADLPRALKAEFYSYLFVFVIDVLCCGTALVGVGNPMSVLYLPLVGLMTVMHPLIGLVLNFAIFAVLYTVMMCGFRQKCATAKSGTYGTKS